MKVSKFLFSKSFVVTDAEKFLPKKIVNLLASKNNKVFAALENTLGFTNDFSNNVEVEPVSQNQVEKYLKNTFAKGVDGVLVSVDVESDKAIYATFLMEAQLRFKEKKAGNFIVLAPLTGNNIGAYMYEPKYKEIKKELAQVGVKHKIINTTPFYLAQLKLQNSANSLSPSLRKEYDSIFETLKTNTSLKFEDQRKALLEIERVENEIIHETYEALTH